MLELKPILERSLMYFRGTDHDGKSLCRANVPERLAVVFLVWLNLCHHATSDKNAEKLLVYWLELHVMETQNAPVTMVLNFQDAGTQNMVSTGAEAFSR